MRSSPRGPRAEVPPACVPAHVPAYWPALDGLRMVCCAAVVIAHCFQGAAMRQGGGLVAYALSNLGRTGVDLFFSLSGFLITRLLLEERGASGRLDLAAFYVRRALRIWPAYYAAVALGFALPLICGSWGGWGAWGDRTLQALGYGRAAEAGAFYRQGLPLYLLFLSNWSSAAWPSGLGRLWSVALEEQFYVLFPLALAATRGRHPALRPALFGLLLAWASRGYLARGGAEQPIYLGTFAHGDPLLLGALLAQALHARPRLVLGLVRAGGAPLELGAVLACALLTAFGFLGERPALGFGLHYLVMALSTTAVVAVLALGRGPLARALCHPAARALGTLTYGAYLFHMYAVALAWAACARLGLSPCAEGALRAALALPLTFALGLASRRLIEAPFLRLRARLGGPR